jgi:hypothetical protein
MYGGQLSDPGIETAAADLILPGDRFPMLNDRAGLTVSV